MHYLEPDPDVLDQVYKTPSGYDITELVRSDPEVSGEINKLGGMSDFYGSKVIMIDDTIVIMTENPDEF